MNNTQVAEILEQTACLLEYRKGLSYLVNEFFDAAERIKTLEVPLEVFAETVNQKQTSSVLDQTVRYWFDRFSPDLLWSLQEVILTGTSNLREHLLREVSPSVVEMIRLKSLPISSIDFIRNQLKIRNVALLKQACNERFLSKTGRFSEQNELDILEEIVKLEQDDSNSINGIVSDQEVFDSLEDLQPDVDDPSVMFWANANALADFILITLQAPFKASIKQTLVDIVSNETISAVKTQAKGALEKVKRFFTPREYLSRKQDQSSIEENLRLKAFSESDANYISTSNQPLLLEKVGAVRRGQESITRLDFLINSNDHKTVFERIKKERFVKDVLFEGNRLLTVVLQSDVFLMPFNNRPTPEVILNFYVASEFVYGTYRVLLTSAPSHWKELERRASLRGYHLTSFGLYEGPKRISSRTEDRLYDLLSLPNIPIELRAGNTEWAWIDSGTPELIGIEDLQGDMHMHTTFTDGTGDVEETVEFARSLDLSYIALTDHTKNVASVGGMNDSEFLRYWDYIDDFNERLRIRGVNFHVLKGAEVDILEDGGLDLEDETLSHADWIVASIHFGKRQNQRQIHSRYMDAFTNPYVDVIAHPTGRMIGMESEIDVDIDFLCENAKKYGKCLELNSQPRRLDLKADYLRIAKKYEVPIVISTDAHAPEQLTYLRYGALQAYRAGLTRNDVLNAWPLEELLKRRKAAKSPYIM